MHTILMLLFNVFQVVFMIFAYIFLEVLLVCGLFLNTNGPIKRRPNILQAEYLSVTQVIATKLSLISGKSKHTHVHMTNAWMHKPWHIVHESWCMYYYSSVVLVINCIRLETCASDLIQKHKLVIWDKWRLISQLTMSWSKIITSFDAIHWRWAKREYLPFVYVPE